MFPGKLKVTIRILPVLMRDLQASFDSFYPQNIFYLGKYESMSGTSLDAGGQLPTIAEITFYPPFSLSADHSTIVGHGTGPTADDKNQSV
jgi:hypothetical protein